MLTAHNTTNLLLIRTARFSVLDALTALILTSLPTQRNN